MVSDTIIRELAGDFARQSVIIFDLRKASVQCDTIIDRQARMIGDLKGLNAEKDQQIALMEKKRKRSKSWRWVERVGLLGAGIFIAIKL